MAEKTRSISGCDSESDIGHDIINIMYPTITFDSSSTSAMNVSQISNTSADSATNVAGGGVGGGGAGGVTQSKTNLNITHNIGGVSKKKSFYFYLFSI